MAGLHQNIPPHVSALGDARAAMVRLVGGGLFLVAVIAGLFVYHNTAPDEGGPEPLQQRPSTFGGGVSSGPDVAPAPSGEDPARLQVRAGPAGTTVYVDGDSVGTTPTWEGPVLEGTRWVRLVTPAGRVVADTLVLAEAGRQTVLDLGPPGRPDAPSPSGPQPVSQTVGAVRVTSAPAGATVRIDGRRVGETPLRLGNLRPGAHSVTVERPGYESTALQVDVRAGGDSEVAVSLRPTPAATPAPPRSASAPSAPPRSVEMGDVEVLVRPWGRIVIDGVPRTQETDVLYHTTLPVGEHRIEALHPTLGSKATTVRVTGSGRVHIEFDLADEAKD